MGARLNRVMAEGETRTLRIGISACLLGERVRHDGGHKRDAFLTEVLAPHVEWVAVCPEVELGLGVPRPPIRLVRGRGTTTRLLVEPTGEDLTARMRAYATWRARGLASLELDGYVWKSASPSCGLARVRVHDDDGHAAPVGRGLFAEALAEALPRLPMEDEARLRHPARREHFVERIFAAARWRDFVRHRARAGDLLTFHAAHKYALLAHSPPHHAALTRLVTTAGRKRSDRVVEEYGTVFAAAMAVRATPARHVAVLQQLAGFFERALADEDRAQLALAIAGYQRRRAPRAVAVALIRYHVARLGVAHLAKQVYLSPPPADLIS